MPWPSSQLPGSRFGVLLILLTCMACAARAQDCTAIGGGYDSHGVYDYDPSDALPGENDDLKKDIKNSNVNAAYNDIWEGADPQTLISGWYHVGLRLFHSMLLMKAVANNNARQVQNLLHQGADPNLDAEDSTMTPLITAASCASPEITALLIQAGAKANQSSSYSIGEAWLITNTTPLIWAAHQGNLEIVQALLHAGANPNAQEIDTNIITNQSNRDTTPLLGDPVLPVLAALLKAGADPNLPDYDGETPLIVAALSGDYEGCYVLLKAGADKRRKDAKGNTAVTAARKSGYPDLADAIINWTPKTPKAAWPHRHAKVR